MTVNQTREPKYFLVSCTLQSFLESIAYYAETGLLPVGFSGPRPKIEEGSTLITHVIEQGVVGAWMVIGELNDISQIWSENYWSKRRVRCEPISMTVLPWGDAIACERFDIWPSCQCSGGEINQDVALSIMAKITQKLKSSHHV